ncbi:hypothetical protein V5O48_016841 [Marasmius crinis-equi]|uniref:Uncharacterized protein n=1 Tax=Marasmius crinis-equi TaxID=585013 RepID=A0ABR3EQM8_9AGAR
MDFTPLSSDTPAQGLGLISEALAIWMKVAAENAVSLVNSHSSEHTDQAGLFKKDIFIRGYIFGLKYLCARLKSPASRQEVFMSFSLCQRAYLELIGRIEWLSRYKQLVNNPPETCVSKLASVVGAVTDHEEVAERLYSSGLPVWLVRPLTKKDFFRVDRWVEAQCGGLICTLRDSGLSINLEDDSPPCETVFEGKLGTLDRYSAMAWYIRRFTTTNVFMVEEPAVSRATVSSSAGPTRTVKTSLNRMTKSQEGKKTGKTGRKVGENDCNKFVDVVSPLMPLSLLNWAKASMAAGFGFDPNAPAPEDKDNGYALPDPGVIAGTANEATQSAYFTTWLRLRTVLMYRLLSPTFRLMRTKELRSVLGLEVHGLKADTRAAARRAEQQKMLQECLTSGGMHGTVDLSNLEATPVRWREQVLEPCISPPLPVAQQILCELFEVKFRYELIALDRFCFRTELSAAEREQQVMGLINHFNNRLVPDATDLGRAGFASSQHNERRLALHGLHTIMEGWNGGPGEMDERLKDLGVGKRLDIADTEDIITPELDSLEYALVFHYVLTFHKIFIRAPLLPHRL